MKIVGTSGTKEPHWADKTGEVTIDGVIYWVCLRIERDANGKEKKREKA